MGAARDTRPVVEVDRAGKRFRRAPSGGRRSVRHLFTRGHEPPKWAFRDVSFTVGQGETVGLLGSNGSGKSTLLRVLSGLTRVTEGRAVVHEPVSGLLTLGEGFHPLLSGEENAVTGAILAGLTRRQAEARLDDIAEFAELGGSMDQPLRTYSDGMRLRLAFSVSIHIDPRILLIDELLAVGDINFREKCLARLEELQDRGITVVLTSHDMSQIRRMCSRAVWLEKGRIRMIGGTEEVSSAYEQAMYESAPVTETGPDGEIRMGTREVELKAVRVLNGRGVETTRLPAGSPLTVEIEYLAHEPVDDAVFAVSAHTDDGVPCLDMSTAGDGQAVGRLAGEGTVRLELERLDLSGGSYRIDVGVYAPEFARTYDYRWRAYPLEVVARGKPGLLGPPHRWKVE